MATDNRTKTLADQIYDLVSSCHGMLEAGRELPEDDPSLHMVYGFATALEEKLSELTDVESIADEREREAAITDDPDDDEPEHLTAAIGDLVTAVELCETVRVFLIQTHESYGETASGVVEQIVKFIRNAWDHVDYAEMEQREYGPRNVANGTERANEQWELLDRMWAIHETGWKSAVQELIWSYSGLAKASPEVRQEVAELRRRGLYFGHLAEFLMMRDKGEIQMAPEKPAE